MRPGDINATVGSLLGFLHQGPQSGWDLVNTAQQAIGDFWSLTRSQVYRELAAMAAEGLISADKVGPRERRPYRLTEAGREAFRRWLDREPGQEQIRYPLLLTLAFARHLEPEQLAGYLHRHRAAHAHRLETYLTTQAEAERDGTAALDLVTLDFGVRYETAVLEWFDHLPPELGSGSKAEASGQPRG